MHERWDYLNALNINGCSVFPNNKYVLLKYGETLFQLVAWLSLASHEAMIEGPTTANRGSARYIDMDQNPQISFPVASVDYPSELGCAYALVQRSNFRHRCL
jgi:hypothetical protein